jgi:hypothetical protein
MPDANSDRVTFHVGRMHGKVLATVLAILSGLGLFVMTLWLVIKGGPDPGPHLRLLSQYFPGYSVTLVGSFVGLFYGALVGGMVGWVIALIYNRIANR